MTDRRIDIHFANVFQKVQWVAKRYRPKCLVRNNQSLGQIRIGCDCLKFLNQRLGLCLKEGLNWIENDWVFWLLSK